MVVVAMTAIIIDDDYFDDDDGVDDDGVDYYAVMPTVDDNYSVAAGRAVEFNSGRVLPARCVFNCRASSIFEYSSSILRGFYFFSAPSGCHCKLYQIFYC